MDYTEEETNGRRKTGNVKWRRERKEKFNQVDRKIEWNMFQNIQQDCTSTELLIIIRNTY